VRLLAIDGRFFHWSCLQVELCGIFLRWHAVNAYVCKYHTNLFSHQNYVNVVNKTSVRKNPMWASHASNLQTKVEITGCLWHVWHTSWYVTFRSV